jgi:protein-S-isoprenylcysteine O-methyltransferase Ste14
VPLALAALLLAQPVLPTTLLGTALVALGLAVRIWAAGLLHKGRELCTSGPYRFLRHPLYFGSSLSALGFCVMAHSLWVWLLLWPVFFVTYFWQVREEERLLAETFGETHAAWSQQVPMLVPRPLPAPAESPRPWSLHQFLVNREHYHVLVTSLLVALFYLKPWLLSRW